MVLRRFEGTSCHKIIFYSVDVGLQACAASGIATFYIVSELASVSCCADFLHQHLQGYHILDFVPASQLPQHLLVAINKCPCCTACRVCHHLCTSQDCISRVYRFAVSVGNSSIKNTQSIVFIYPVLIEVIFQLGYPAFSLLNCTLFFGSCDYSPKLLGSVSWLFVGVTLVGVLACG